MIPPPRTKNCRIHSEEEEAVSLAIKEQERFHLQGEVNGEKALQQLFQFLYPEDIQYVNLLSTAFRRFTPATLIYMNRNCVNNFLQDMAPEFTILKFKYSAEADLRAVFSLSYGKNPL